MPVLLRRAFVIALLGAVLGTLAVPAHAQDPAEAVTLEANKEQVRFGNAVRLTGEIDPSKGGETVNIVDGDANVVASATTDDDGRYETTLAPTHNETLRAQWLAAVSDPAEVKVTPLVKARISKVQLFGKGRATGSIRPAHPGGSVQVTIMRSGHRYLSKKVRLNNGRFFSFKFNVDKPGRFRARARFDDSDHAPGAALSSVRKTRTPHLSVGDKGKFVRLLESRLDELGFHLPGVNKRFDYRTSDAMIAFNKVHDRSRVGSVDAATWGVLARPRIPKMRSPSRKTHFEVDQTRQVLYYVKNRKVVKMIHVSTGAGSATRDGVWHVHRKLAGYSGGGLYYPSYFDGLRAFHGWSEVPTYNASHGCVRLPMWTATWVFDRAPIGIEVRIYH